MIREIECQQLVWHFVDIKDIQYGAWPPIFYVINYENQFGC